MSPDLIDLSSTESTGGSTTGDDEAAGGDGGGGRDAACGGADSTLSQETRAPSTLLETRRNTQVSRGLLNPNQGAGPPNYWNIEKIYVYNKCPQSRFASFCDAVLETLFLCSSGSNIHGKSRALEGRRVSSKSP